MPPQLPEYALFPDTNCLFTKNESNIVSGYFTKTLQELAKICQIKLVISEVVRDELLSQKYDECRGLYDLALSKLSKIEKISGQGFPNLPPIEVIKQQLSEKFDQWIKTADGDLEKIQYEKIDWPQIVEKAIWRNPPFSPRSQDSESTEKGFKDALVLETLSRRFAITTCEFILLTKDGLLKDAANGRIGENDRFSLFPSLGEFASHVRLLHETQTKKFAEAAMAKVPSVFFQPGDPDCVWLKFKVVDEIHKRFPTISSESAHAPSPYYLPPALYGVQPRLLKAITGEKWAIEETEFVNRTNLDIFHWQTRVSGYRMFDTVDKSPFAVSSPQIRTWEFLVKWEARVSDKFVFSDLDLEDIVEEQTSFRLLTLDERGAWGLALSPVYAWGTANGLVSSSGSPTTVTVVPYAEGNLRSAEHGFHDSDSSPIVTIRGQDESL
jgi:PIN domain